ncbi:MAG: hypothetical protein R2830_01075 [Saprospiraceae bacterium]
MPLPKSVMDYEEMCPVLNHNLPQFDDYLKVKLLVKWTGSVFNAKNGCCRLITVWRTEIIKEEARFRTGEGYKHYNYEHRTIFSIFFDNVLIDDQYLNSFLPENNLTTKSDYIPGYMPETFHFSSKIDEKLTEDIRNKYDSIEHYKFLLTQGRISKKDDSEVFR